jgi:hypothetical protein
LDEHWAIFGVQFAFGADKMNLRNRALILATLLIMLSGSVNAQQSAPAQITTTQTPASPPSSTTPQTTTSQQPSTSPPQQPVQDRTPPAAKPGNAHARTAGCRLACACEFTGANHIINALIACSKFFAVFVNARRAAEVCHLSGTSRNFHTNRRDAYAAHARRSRAARSQSSFDVSTSWVQRAPCRGCQASACRLSAAHCGCAICDLYNAFD